MRQSVPFHGVSLIAAIVTWMAAGSLLAGRLGHQFAPASDWMFFAVVFALVFGPIVALIRQGTITMPNRRKDGAPS